VQDGRFTKRCRCGKHSFTDAKAMVAAMADARFKRPEGNG
jgi:hypothetical protein